LLFTALAELSTRGVAENEKAIGFGENSIASEKGGQVANRAKKDFEKLTGKKVISEKNFLSIKKEPKKVSQKKKSISPLAP